MSELCAWDETRNDVEAMVRAAGHYVSALDDLRPRVLEDVPLQSCEQKTRYCLRHATLFVMLLAFFTADSWPGADSHRIHEDSTLVLGSYEELISPTPVAVRRSGDGDWRMLDVFIKVRRQQAQLLRCEI